MLVSCVVRGCVEESGPCAGVIWRFFLIVLVDHHHVGGRGCGGEVIAKAYCLHICGLHAELDEALAYGVRAAVRKGAGMSRREVGAGVSCDEQPLFRPRVAFSCDAADGLLVRAGESDRILIEHQSWACWCERRIQR